MDPKDPQTRKMVFNILDAVPVMMLMDYLETKYQVDLEKANPLNHPEPLVMEKAK